LEGLNFNHDIDLETKEGIAFQLHEANTGLKDFESALHAYETYTRINDSIATVTKTRQLEELQIKYQTRENAQSIKLLQSASKYQQAELASSKFQKKAYIAGACTALLIAGIAFWGYHGKKRSNLKLEAKQVEINRQNGMLQMLLTDKDQLIGDKDSLLTEKELLLREIHHRVKNNLQIIISLLSLQSSYLKNDLALEAIHESQGRIRSIALIHQKLYGNSDVRQIGMNEYIPELINYLGDCLGVARKNIAINYSIPPVNLDISQAVPIGLIINEAITNSIKYAFVDRDNGEIHILMTDQGTGGIKLSIADNGKGLASEIDVEPIKTMGLSLIKGLVDQLGGSCEFINNNGFVINLSFVKDAFFVMNTKNDEAVIA
jgi:two-component sensor histidine kinase